MGLFKKNKPESNSTGNVKILFTTDLHGSETAFRKFLNAGLMTKADVLIIGGDLAGKSLIPIIDIGNGKFKVEEKVIGREGLDEIIKKYKSSGIYYTIVDQRGLVELNENKKALDEEFKRVILERLQEWDKIAEEKLKGTNLKVYTNLGNDDPLYMFDVISKSERLVKCEGEIVNINGYEMVTFGYVNPTPWNTPREMTEDQIYSNLKQMIEKVENPDRTIFNLHAPPYGTNLDNAPLLDKTLKPVVRNGEIVMTHVGSTAIRKLEEEFQPLLGIHGHIHESRAFDKIGKTVIINPGSEYGIGLLHATYIVLENNKVKTHQFIIG
ncbi:metallophosphoesterase [Sulfolobus tengchongensis]|uniref:Metallophosphoesterase n=1 Tax=Sulfolobus tengchongensis TaxID=207809 RepID=A0AAX4L5U6_9CREN